MRSALPLLIIAASALVLIAAALVLIAAQGADSARQPPLFEDTFDGKLADGWMWVREDKKAWRADKDGLHVRNQFGSLWGGGNDARNVLLRPLPATPDGAKALAVDVTVRHAPEINAEQAGIVYHVDDENYVKLIVESLEKKRLIVFAREHKGEPKVVASIPLPHDAPRLRMIVAPDGLRGQFLAKDDTWQELGKCEFPGDEAARKNARVGLVCHGGPHEVERWARFNDFRISMNDER